MDFFEEIKICEDAINKYGEHHQKVIAMEEMSELTKELCKEFRGENNLCRITEEMADVEIMLLQLKEMYHNAVAVEEMRDIKMQRLKKRLQEK